MKRILKQGRTCLPLLALGILTAPQITLPAHAGLFSMSEQDEIQAGRQVAAQAEKEYGGVLPYNDPMAVRVRAIGNQFAQLSTRKNIPYTYKVLNNDKVLNAFAAPGGPIYVTRRLVTTASNDAELAYVLGHETAHIERKHIVDSVKKQQQAGILVGVLGAVLGRGKGGNVIGTIANVGWTVLSRGHSRDHENESDTVGVRWMSQLGYEPRAAISMLGKLRDGGSSGFLDKYLATHPDPKLRQQMVQQTIDKENLTDVARRVGGPRLAMAGGQNYGNNYGGSIYGGSDYSAHTDSGSYPPYSGPNNSAPSNYPPDSSYPSNSNSPSTSNYPASSPSSTSNNGGRIELSAPLLVVKRENANIVIGPVLELAQWAGASVRNVNERTTRIQRNGNTLDLRLKSKLADINGQRVTMNVATTESRGRLYAPLGAIIQGMGGEATYDPQTHAVWVTLDGRRGYIPMP